MAYEVDQVGVCPHCRTTVRFEAAACLDGPVTRPSHSKHPATIEFYHQGYDTLRIGYMNCPSCSGLVMTIGNDAEDSRLLWPASVLREPLHSEVPKELAKDYTEAVAVLPYSTNASAALARRCLQSLLVKQGAKKHKLIDQIEEMYDTFPSYVQGAVDKVRDLGNLASHARQDKATAEVVDVEPGEAEWLLELLEELFDHCFAKPADTAVRIAQIETKLGGLERLKR